MVSWTCCTDFNRDCLSGAVLVLPSSRRPVCEGGCENRLPGEVRTVLKGTSGHSQSGRSGHTSAVRERLPGNGAPYRTGPGHGPERRLSLSRVTKMRVAVAVLRGRRLLLTNAAVMVAAVVH